MIDVRPNSGGDEVLAQKVAAWFVEGRKVLREAPRPAARGQGRIRAGRGARRSKATRTPSRRYDHAHRGADEPLRHEQQRVVRDDAPPGEGLHGRRPADLREQRLPEARRPAATASSRSCRRGSTFGPTGPASKAKAIAPDVLVEVDPAVLREKDPILEKALEVLRGKIGK